MNKISKAFVAFLLLHTSIASAQIGQQDRPRTGVMYDLELFAQSNQFDADFVFKDRWDDELKQRQLDRNPGLTKLGWGTGHELGYRWGALGEDAFNKVYYVRVGYKDLRALDLDPQLTKIALLGNSHTRGREIAVGRSASSTYEYTSIGFGISKKLQKNQQKLLELGASVMVGHQLNTQYTSEGTIKTDSMLEHITLDLDYRSESNSRALSSGMGLGFDFAYSQNTGNRYFRFELHDLGFINWSNTNTLENAQRPQSFEGVFVPDFQISEFNWLDSVNNELLTKETTSVLRLTPFRVSVTGEVRLKAYSALKLKARYMYFTGFFPEVSAQYAHIWKANRADFGLKYGGFGTLRSDISLALQIQNRFHIRVAAESLESLVLKEIPFGMAVRSGVIWNL